MEKKKPMRELMPHCAAFIDSMRDAFGAEGIDAEIKRMQREGTWYAVESGHVLGNPPREVLVMMGIEIEDKKEGDV
jgi:hypothetical protein